MGYMKGKINPAIRTRDTAVQRCQNNAFLQILSIFAILRDFGDVTMTTYRPRKNFATGLVHNYTLEQHMLGLAISISVLVSDITELPILS